MFRQISLASNAPWVWGIQAQKPENFTVSRGETVVGNRLEIIFE